MKYPLRPIHEVFYKGERCEAVLEAEGGSTMLYISNQVNSSVIYTTGYGRNLFYFRSRASRDSARKTSPV